MLEVWCRRFCSRTQRLRRFEGREGSSQGARTLPTIGVFSLYFSLADVSGVVFHSRFSLALVVLLDSMNVLKIRTQTREVIENENRKRRH